MAPKIIFSRQIKRRPSRITPIDAVPRGLCGTGTRILDIIASPIRYEAAAAPYTGTGVPATL
jgi:hypothetical protein